MKLFVYRSYRPQEYGSILVAAKNQKEADTVVAMERVRHVVPVIFEKTIPKAYVVGNVPGILEDTTGPVR